jgi:hypothetical protein
MICWRELQFAVSQAALGIISGARLNSKLLQKHNDRAGHQHKNEATESLKSCYKEPSSCALLLYPQSESVPIFLIYHGGRFLQLGIAFLF